MTEALLHLTPLDWAFVFNSEAVAQLHAANQVPGSLWLDSGKVEIVM